MPRNLFTILTLLPLLGCSAIHSKSDEEMFKVDSVPVGASVLVMGEAMGQTPMSLHKRDVFPRLFAPLKQHLYGRIELIHPGCEPFVSTVNSRIISEGLNARLNCDSSAPPVTSPTPQPQQSPDIAAEGEVSATLRQRLQRLKALFEEKLISEEDYATKRRQLLEEL